MLDETVYVVVPFCHKLDHVLAILLVMNILDGQCLEC